MRVCVEVSLLMAADDDDDAAHNNDKTDGQHTGCDIAAALSRSVKQACTCTTYGHDDRWLTSSLPREVERTVASAAAGLACVACRVRLRMPANYDGRLEAEFRLHQGCEA